MQKTILINIKKWLQKPLPFYDSYKQKIFLPTLISLLVMLGIIILTPHENTEMLFKQILDVFKYGFIVIFISLIYSLILPELFPKAYNPEKWNVQKTLILFIATLLTISICITLFVYFFDNPNNKHFIHYFFTIFIRSITLSFFPIIIIVFYSERILYKKNHLRAIEIIEELKTNQQTEQNSINNSVFTFAENTKDEIKVAESELIYIKAEGNYCSLFFIKKSILEKQLIRSSLKDIGRIISESNHFLRCHKSYIVNLNKISKVTGNAKGYTFYLIDNRNKIPASRNLSKSLIENIKNNKSKN